MDPKSVHLDHGRLLRFSRFRVNFRRDDAARLVHPQFHVINHAICRDLCQRGYAAFSVSASNKRTVMDYIAEQQRHHQKRNFEEELVAMLHKSEIDYDSRFIFG
jgi:isopentenyl phosphate kinase